jgi:hypothetical protein
MTVVNDLRGDDAFKGESPGVCIRVEKGNSKSRSLRDDKQKDEQKNGQP